MWMPLQGLAKSWYPLSEDWQILGTFLHIYFLKPFICILWAYLIHLGVFYNYYLAKSGCPPPLVDRQNLPPTL